MYLPIIVLPGPDTTKPENCRPRSKRKRASAAWTEALRFKQYLYFFVALQSMNGIQFLPSIDISNFML